MQNNRMLDIMVQAFLDNITLSALFGKLRRPGAPVEMKDDRSPLEYTISLYKGKQTTPKREIQIRLQKGLNKKTLTAAPSEKEAADIAYTVSRHAEMVEHSR